MSRKPIIAKIFVAALLGICVYGLIRGIAAHSLAQVFFSLSAILGGIGFYRNPHYLGATVNDLPGVAQRSFDRLGHGCFRGATIMCLAGIMAFITSR